MTKHNYRFFFFANNFSAAEVLSLAAPLTLFGQVEEKLFGGIK